MEPTDQATAKTVASTGVLTRRMLGGVVLGVLAFAIVYRLALALQEDGTIAIAAGAAASLAVASVMMWRTVAPLVKTQAELQVRYEAAVADALRDPLTGLGNHRAFHEELDRQVAAALRYDVPLSLLLIDIDDFKSINDSHGHANGDRHPADFARHPGSDCHQPGNGDVVAGTDHLHHGNRELDQTRHEGYRRPVDIAEPGWRRRRADGAIGTRHFAQRR